MENIVLIGFASSGKTVVGRALAARLHSPFIDLDDRIQDEAQARFGTPMACRIIYQKHGEKTFRELETVALQRLELTTPTVVATGGGTPIAKENQEVLAQLGTLVYLKSSPQAIYNRIHEKGFPAYLQDDPTLENLARFVEARDAVYRQLASITIDRTALDVHQTVDCICAAMTSQVGTISPDI